jgi:hypothetical protein
LIKKQYDNFADIGLPKLPFEKMISPYWYQYIHFGNKRSKCLDCDNTE